MLNSKNFNIKDIFITYKNTFLESKKYWIVYLAFLALFSLSMIKPENIYHPKFEIICFILIALLGIFCIVYCLSHNSDNELHKSAFVIIICFGLICAMIVPIADVSDEHEHLVRSEITSNGVISPHWTGEEMGLTALYNYSTPDSKGVYNKGAGYETISSVQFFIQNRGITVFETQGDVDKINYSTYICDSAFEHNPFYGYIPQAFGMVVAKLLDLNVIWLMWLGRIFNLVSYAILVSISIKIIPKLKMPLLVVACIPLAIYQAASLSIDSMIMGLGLCIIACFVHMCQAEDFTVDYKNIIVFTALTILMGLCKLPFLAFILLLFCIPKRKFKENEHLNIVLLCCFAMVLLIGISWSHFSQIALLHSFRSSHYVNPSLQISYYLSHPMSIVNLFNQIFNDELFMLHNGFFNFYQGSTSYHYVDKYYFISIILEIFLILILFAYPEKIKFDLKTRIGSFGIILIVYIGTCIVQLLSWSKIGGNNLGLSLRYFIPLIALVPIIFKIDYSVDNKDKFDKWAMVFIIVFMAALIMSFATKYY